MERVVLYDSYARNEAHEWSAIDIAVISPDFEKLSSQARIKLLARLLRAQDWRLMSFAYTPPNSITPSCGNSPLKFGGRAKSSTKRAT